MIEKSISGFLKIMWTIYYMNKFPLVTGIGCREGHIKQLSDGHLV